MCARWDTSPRTPQEHTTSLLRLMTIQLSRPKRQSQLQQMQRYSRKQQEIRLLTINWALRQPALPMARYWSLVAAERLPRSLQRRFMIPPREILLQREA